MTVPFAFGPKSAGPGGCCGKPVGCNISSQGCIHKVEKKAWQERAALEVRRRNEGMLLQRLEAIDKRLTLTRLMGLDKGLVGDLCEDINYLLFVIAEVVSYD